MEDEIPEEVVAFVGCTCDHESSQHGWTGCDVAGCPCKGRWEE